MAYDRYERGRERDWRGHDQERRGRHEERGFFERAGDEIASWFGGDDDDRPRHERERMSREREWRGRTGGDERYSAGGWGSEPGRREFERGQDRDRYRGGWDEPRGGFRQAGWSSGDRDFSPGMERGSGRYRPMTGDYGRSEDSWGRDDWRRTGPNRDNDQHYQSWRRRQLDELDRDYDQYCRERQDRFETDFGSWRQTRQQKRQQLGSIREHMDVVGSDGETIGRVDKVRGDRIILTKSDSDDNRHHSIDCSMIDSVEGEQVRLSMPAEEAKSRWQDSEEDRGGLFGGSGERDFEEERGEVNLERSFSGTYR